MGNKTLHTYKRFAEGSFVEIVPVLSYSVHTVDARMRCLVMQLDPHVEKNMEHVAEAVGRPQHSGSELAQAAFLRSGPACPLIWMPWYGD